MLLIKYVCIQIFVFVGVSVIEILEFNRKKRKKISVSLVFNMFLTLMLVEVKLNGI